LRMRGTKKRHTGFQKSYSELGFGAVWGLPWRQLRAARSHTSEEVDTPPHDGGKASLVDWVDRASFPFDLANDFLHVDGVPVGNGVEDQTEDAKVFLLLLPQRISDFPALAQEQLAAEAVAGFLPVELDENAPAESRVVDISEDMESFDDPPEFGQGARQRCRLVLDLHHAHDAGGSEVAEFQGAGEADEIRPILKDQRQIDFARGDAVQGAVVDAAVNAPEVGLGVSLEKTLVSRGAFDASNLAPVAYWRISGGSFTWYFSAPRRKFGQKPRVCAQWPSPWKSSR
jgi:hypothetical protein